MTTQPITPAEVGARKAAQIPNRIIEIVSDLIAQKFAHGRAVVQQKDIVSAIRRDIDLIGGDPADIWEKNWLDFEPIFENAGWTVVYEKPGYNEPGDATFTFIA